MPVRPGIRRLLRLSGYGARDAERDVDQEMQLHIALRAEELMSGGLDRASAEAEARRLFAVDAETLRDLYFTAKDRNQHMRMRERFESWLQDTRYAVRALGRDRIFTLFVVLALALGIGANVTAFTLLDRVLVRDPAHVIKPDEVVRLYGRVKFAPGDEQTSSWIPWANYQHLRENMRTLEPIGAYRVREAVIGKGVSARTMRVGQATGTFFQVFGVRPVYGRFFMPAEDAASAGPLAIISEDLWRTQFAGDPAAVGGPLIIAHEVHTIVGIAPSGFSGGELRRIDVWQLGSTRNAGNMNWQMVGRLRAGITIASASADGLATHRSAGEIGPKWASWFRVAIIFAAPLRFNDKGEEPVEVTMARWLAIVCAIILVVTMANVVNLLLVRLARRRRELAVRVALGSGRGRVIRLLSLEGALLAVAAGAVSLLIARNAEPMVRHALFAGEANWTRSITDLRVAVILFAIVVLTAIVVGIVPAVQAGSRDLTNALRSGTQGGAGSNSRTRSALTVAQAALSVALLVGAGLFLRSLAKVNGLDFGVDRDRVIVVRAEFPSEGRFKTFAALEQDIYRRMATAVSALPQVENASVAIGLPLDGGSFSANVFVPGRDSIPSLPGGGPFVSVVDAAYFSTAGTRILAGRTFSAQDRAGSEPVVIVGQTMARTLWPGGDAVGRCMSYGLATAPCARIVGVVADVHRVGLHEEASMQYYIPHGQQSMFGGARLIVRPRESPALSVAQLQQTVLAVDARISSVDIEPLSESLAVEMRPLRLGLVTFGLSSVLALLVSVLGLYGLMSYTVAWQTREIGVRLALGASETQVTRLIVSNGTRLATLGIVIGLSLALFAGRWIQPHLFETSAADPLVLIGVALILLAVALLAGLLPARRALRISPTEALRTE